MFRLLFSILAMACLGLILLITLNVDDTTTPYETTIRMRYSDESRIIRLPSPAIINTAHVSDSYWSCKHKLSTCSSENAKAFVMMGPNTKYTFSYSGCEGAIVVTHWTVYRLMETVLIWTILYMMIGIPLLLLISMLLKF